MLATAFVSIGSPTYKGLASNRNNILHVANYDKCCPKAFDSLKLYTVSQGTSGAGKALCIASGYGVSYPLLQTGCVPSRLTSCSTPALLKAFLCQQKLFNGKNNTHGCSRSMACKTLVSNAQYEPSKPGKSRGTQKSRESKTISDLSCSVRR